MGQVNMLVTKWCTEKEKVGEDRSPPRLRGPCNDFNIKNATIAKKMAGTGLASKLRK